MTIDGIRIEEDFPKETTLLDVAQGVGIVIPTVCFMRECTEPSVSCMICGVRDNASGRMLPACATWAEDGMDIDTRGEDVVAARRQSVRLLLEKHPRLCKERCGRRCPQKSAGVKCPDCRCAHAPECPLRKIADALDAWPVTPVAESGQRHRCSAQGQERELFFEPDKCIVCGNCVRVSRAMREPVGLAWLGRGDSLRVAPPLGRAWEETLTVSAEACAKACPTGCIN